MRKFIAILLFTIIPTIAFCVVGGGDSGYKAPSCTTPPCSAGCYDNSTEYIKQCTACDSNQYSYIQSDGKLSDCTKCEEDALVDSGVNFTAEQCCVSAPQFCMSSVGGGGQGGTSQMNTTRAARAPGIGNLNSLQRACIRNIEWTGPGAGLNACNATITCADGRYWGGEKYGCTLCPETYRVNTSTYNRFDPKTMQKLTINGVESNKPLFGDEFPCTQCVFHANGSRTSCQFGVSYDGYLDKDGNEVNGNTTYYNVGSTFTLLSEQRVEAGKYFVGWTCKKSVCAIGSCAVQTCFYTEPGQTVTENLETFYYFTANAEDCPIGFYCPGGTDGKQPCPPGLTTNSAGAQSVDECGVKAGVTVFEDSKGKFKLPGTWFAYPAK